MPAQDPQRARRLIAELELGQYRSRGMTTFDEGIYPDHLVVGAYEGAAVIGAPEIIDACQSRGDDRLMRRVLGRFPAAAVLRLGLASVVNFWSYEYFEGGRLLRAYAGSADTGVTTDQGEWLPEERPHFERSVARDGERWFSADVGGTTQEFNAAGYAEELAFAVIGRFFGCRPDQVDAEVDPLELPMESFDRQAPMRWWWPFPKR
jgi:hypothetical protein